MSLRDFGGDLLFVLQVYMKLTGTKAYCLPTGEHWMDIGFQGTSPLTDLRGAGMLGLSHLLWVATNHGQKARIILRDVDQSSYGFAAVSINFSLMALNALRCAPAAATTALIPCIFPIQMWPGLLVLHIQNSECMA